MKPHVCRSFWQPIALLSVFFLFFPSIAWSIPSPDLVINMFASGAQLIGLGAAVLGAGFLGRRRTKNHSTLSRNSKWLFWSVSLLLLISISANLLQYLRQADEQNQRLQTNLWRSSNETGKKVGDTSLKTLPFSKQLKSPYGISTDALSAWIEEKRPLNLIDVRETEEYEIGNINGAQQSRYPDTQLNAAKLLSKDKENVLLCYSGNRSSELCMEFAKQGIPCRFMIGGYEKWIAENRPLAGTGNKGVELRGLPTHPNHDTLLDTTKATEMFLGGNVLFIDVRYPGDFAQQHLPDAVNIPIRKMTSAEIDEALANLPRKPVIATCYDKRSCFYAKILGIKLWRLGYNYLGRYTVPQEFALPNKEKSYVAEWRASQEQQTLLGFAIVPLHNLLTWAFEKTGSLTAAILMSVALLRCMVLPISYRSERDSFIQKKIASEVNSLKERWEADRTRLSRALMRLYQREGLSPGLNLTGNIIQLILFLMFFSVVQTISKGSTEPFLWIPSLGEPDPLRLLPLAVAALIVMYLLNMKASHTRLYLAGCIGAGLALMILTIQLNAASNIYLVGSLIFLVAQNRIINAMFSRKEQPCFAAIPIQPSEAGVVKLKDAYRCANLGNKASRLGQMMASGIQVPDGFVVTDEILNNLNSKSSLIHQAFDKLKTNKVAVRSTGLAEDGEGQSFAGVFESVLNVTKEYLLEAIARVRSSYDNNRVKAYSSDTHTQGSVLVQSMVPAEYAGVLFTRHPNSTGSMLIEFVQGLGEDLVSGNVKPHAVQYGRVSSAPLEDAHNMPIDFKPLIQLGLKVEGIFSRPQDIEWAYANGQFFILQARDITTPAAEGENTLAIMEAERQRLLHLALGESDFEKTIYAQNELAELLPRPTPMSLSLMESLWSCGGATDIACSMMGIPYDVHDDSPPYILTLFGSLYVNSAEGARRISKGTGALASFRLSRQADEIRKSFFDEFLPKFQKEMRLREAIEHSRLSAAELIQLFDEWRTQFVAEVYVHAETINIASDFYLKTAERALKKHGLDPAVYLGSGPETIMQRAYALLPEIKNSRRPLSGFLDLYGHRALHDYELSEQRYNEHPESLNVLVQTAVITAPLQQTELPKSKYLKAVVERAQLFQCLKEDAKHHCIRALASLRPLLLELDKRLQLDGGIFYLRSEEISTLLPSNIDSAKKNIQSRKQHDSVFKAATIPTELSVLQLEKMTFDSTGRINSSFTNTGALSGKRVSGHAEIIGHVRVMEHPEAAASFQDGEIIVARFAEPELYTLFPRAAGIITEVGGWLSHMAIVAREYQLPCIVQANGATHGLKTGQMVRLCSNGMIERRLSAHDRRKGPKTVSSNRRQQDRRQAEQ